jgi:hypothetical protein
MNRVRSVRPVAALLGEAKPRDRLVLGSSRQSAVASGGVVTVIAAVPYAANFLAEWFEHTFIFVEGHSKG